MDCVALKTPDRMPVALYATSGMGKYRRRQLPAT